MLLAAAQPPRGDAALTDFASHVLFCPDMRIPTSTVTWFIYNVAEQGNLDDDDDLIHEGSRNYVSFSESMA